MGVEGILSREAFRARYDRVFRRLTRAAAEDIDVALRRQYAQIEALIGLYATLDIAIPLMPMRGFPMSPDAASIIATDIVTRRPKTIVELGSGVSTVIAAYAAKKIGSSRVVSLEHDGAWARRAQALVRDHGLESFAMVRHAPLQRTSIAGEDWQWYDLGALADVSTIDLLVVDGPPARTQRLARFPAVPVLYDSLAPDGVIMLDDADRADEQETVRCWQRQFGPFGIERPAAEKGLVVLSRRVEDSSVRSD